MTKRLVNILIVTILAGGWKWADYLQKKEFISDQAPFLLTMTFLLILQQFLFTMPKPVKAVEIEKNRDLIENHLGHLLAQYYEYLESKQLSQFPGIKINVMLPTITFWGKFFGHRLQINYSVCANSMIYKPEELEIGWKKGQGTGGFAWKIGRCTIFDSKNKDLSAPEKKMSKEQKNHVQDIASVLSAPIYNDKKIVGTLNLDSSFNTTDTFFCDEKIIKLVRAFAQPLGSVLPNDGVKAY